MDVRHRAGYLASDPGPLSGNASSAAIHDALTTPLAATAVGLTVRVESSGTSYLFIMAVDPKGLSLEHKDGKWTGEADFAFLGEAGDGHPIDTSARPVNLDLSDTDYQKAQRDGILLKKSVPGKDGLARIRIVVVDPRSGNVGSLRVALPQGK